MTATAGINRMIFNRAVSKPVGCIHRVSPLLAVAKQATRKPAFGEKENNNGFLYKNRLNIRSDTVSIAEIQENDIKNCMNYLYDLRAKRYIYIFKKHEKDTTGNAVSSYPFLYWHKAGILKFII